MKSDMVTCSFVMDRKLYNTYKSIITANGENVKGNLINYMKSVIRYNTPNADTLKALQEVEALKKDPNRTVYESFSEVLEELAADE